MICNCSELPLAVMGRNINEENKSIHEQFQRQNGNSQCKHCKNETIIPGMHTGNLQIHLKRKHPDILQDIKNKYLKKSKNNQKTLVEMGALVVEKQKVSFDISSNEMVEYCVELVTVNGMPLNAVECSGLKHFFDPICQKLGITINRHNIREHIMKKSENYRLLIIKEIENKILSLKVDSATRLDRSVLGINIQFEKNNQICVRTLAVKELRQKHTAEYISEQIKEVLDKYNIKLEHIYTFTSDNGRNMIKAADLLGIAQEDEIDEEPIYNEAELDELFISCSNNESFKFLTSVKCMAHSLQLAVNDVITTSDVYKTIISKALSLVIILRTPTILALIKAKGLKKPIRNVITRWNSTYNMIIRLSELRDFCEEMKVVYPTLAICNNDWRKMEQIIKTLKYPYATTLRLQSENLTMSEAYAAWFKCKLELSKIGDAYSIPLKSSIVKREKTLLTKCGPMISAVFLDPRYQNLLSADEKEFAKAHLVCVYRHLLLLEKKEKQPENEDIEIVEDKSGIDILTEYMVAKSKQPISKQKVNISPLFDNFDNMEIMPVNTNIFEFWQNKNQLIEKIAKIVLAVPASQVSVERVFSILKWILSEKRNRIEESLLEEILLIISNSNKI